MGFRGLVVDQVDGAVRAELREMTRDELPAGDVLVRVAYSSFNYKDGLALTGQGRIIRQYPMVPGIDLAGTVVESTSPEFSPGDRVLATGWGLGERHSGGLAELARLRSDWLLPLPDGLDARRAMALGTAGLTAMLCVLALEEHGVRPGGRPVVVTGAGGGVGSVAVALLARAGHEVTASTGRGEELGEYLRALGANEILAREVLAERPAGPLASERWGGAVDTVGGATLAGLLASVGYYGAVASCGLAGGASLQTTVVPFILRGIALLGVESVRCPQPRRRQAWARLARDLPREVIDRLSRLVPLAEVPALAGEILAGRIRGRTVVEVAGEG